jgi:signal transduction histidine kinase
MLFAALNFAVFESVRPGCLSPIQSAPAWLRSLCLVEEPFPIEETFPFLSGFLQVATAWWDNREQGPLLSDIWVQADQSGNDLALRATAVLSDDRRWLLIEKKLERVARELAAANLEAERVVRDKGDFLAGMSHDLRTPLNAMRGFSTLLLQGRAGELNDKQKGYLEHVMRAADHLLDLINDVLDLSKIEAGFLELRREVFAFDQALEEVLATIVPLAQSKGITIETTPGHHMVHADRIRFRQILFNLLSNALQFTAVGGLIAISAAVGPEWLEVCVKDTGIGIPQGGWRLFSGAITKPVTHTKERVWGLRSRANWWNSTAAISV